MIEEDPVIQNAIKNTEENSRIVESTVTLMLNSIMRKVEDKNDEFELKHGFIALGQTINYLAQTLCDNHEMFQDEMSKVSKLVTNNVMGSLGTIEECEEDSDVMENYSLRRLMMLSGAIIDNIFWRESLGDYSEEVAEEIKTDKTNSAS